MINFLGCSAQAIAVANGVTTIALLERLVERRFLPAPMCGPFSEMESSVWNRALVFGPLRRRST